MRDLKRRLPSVSEDCESLQEESLIPEEIRLRRKKKNSDSDGEPQKYLRCTYTGIKNKDSEDEYGL